MTDTDIWNWISAFIQSFAETFLLVNVYCAFLGQPRIKKYVAYSLISCFAIAYCVFINVFTLPTYLRYSLSLCVFFAYSMAWNGPGWKRLFAVCTDVTINALASSIVYWLIDFMRTDRGTCLTIDSVLFATPNVLILVTISMIFRYFYSSAWENLKVSPLQWLILTLYPGVAFLVTISLFSIPVWDIGNHILLIVDAVGLLLAMVIHFVLVDLLNEHNTKTKQDKLLHQQIQMESEKANALYDVYLQQRHLTHDFTNQLNTIAGLLEQGDTASALDLIRSSSTEIHINTLVVNTGNPMIDTLLSQKYNEAQKKSIPVLFSLCDLSECPISSRDLLVLLGNLVDNAIEASEKMANPCIQIKLQRSDNDFGFPCPLSIFIIVRDSIPAFSASKTWVSPASVRVVRNQVAKVAFGSCIMFHLIPILQVLFLREKELRFLFLMHHKSRLRKLGIYSMINARTSIEIIVVYSF